MDLRAHMPYRVARNVPSKIAGKAVVFLGWLRRPWDIARARVCLLNPDGSCGQEWLVAPGILVPV